MKRIEFEDGTRVIFYKQLKKCLEACFGEYDPECDWNGFGVDGHPYCYKMKEAVKNIKEVKSWGWVEDKTIHIWANRDVKCMALLRLLAHEFGHSEKPHCHKDGGRKDEIKAGRYENVLEKSFLSAQYIFKELNVEL